MPNECPIIITRGKNKGKACGDVNKKCRHRNNQCPYCGIRFTVETSYSRHVSSCNGECPMPMPVKQIIEVREKEQPAIPVKKTVSTKQVHNVIKVGNGKEPSNRILLQKIEKLERELEEVKQTPTVHHHWNIVLGMNFFDELVLKMGKNHAISFLSGIAKQGKPVDVINKLYLEGNSPVDYPIACRDSDHFRYIDSEHRVIDDKGGHEISKIVTTGVQDALILAANESINEHILDDNYDFRVLQKYVADMKKSLPKDRIISDLAHITSIPNHPFFTIEEQDK